MYAHGPAVVVEPEHGLTVAERIDGQDMERRVFALRVLDAHAEHLVVGLPFAAFVVHHTCHHDAVLRCLLCFLYVVEVHCYGGEDVAHDGFSQPGVGGFALLHEHCHEHCGEAEAGVGVHHAQRYEQIGRQHDTEHHCQHPCAAVGESGFKTWQEYVEHGGGEAQAEEQRGILPCLGAEYAHPVDGNETVAHEHCHLTQLLQCREGGVFGVGYDGVWQRYPHGGIDDGYGYAECQTPCHAALCGFLGEQCEQWRHHCPCYAVVLGECGEPDEQCPEQVAHLVAHADEGERCRHAEHKAQRLVDGVARKHRGKHAGRDAEHRRRHVYGGILAEQTACQGEHHECAQKVGGDGDDVVVERECVCILRHIAHEGVDGTPNAAVG